MQYAATQRSHTSQSSTPRSTSQSAQAKLSMRCGVSSARAPELQAVGRRKRWLFLRSWGRLSADQRHDMGSVLAARVPFRFASTSANRGPGS